MSRMSELHTQQHDEKEPCPTCDNPCALQVTLHDLMGEDHYPRLTRTEDAFGYDFELINDDTDVSTITYGVHPDAVDGLAVFCRRYLATYNKIHEVTE